MGWGQPGTGMPSYVEAGFLISEYSGMGRRMYSVLGRSGLNAMAFQGFAYFKRVSSRIIADKVVRA